MIILQAGHYNRMVGSTGAPGEKEFNWDVANKVAAELTKYGKEVRVVRADPAKDQIAGDFELFLAIHYDADIYGKGGYLVDFCEPSMDGVTEESQRIAKILETEYGRVTGIVNHPERSNINTRQYYMWKQLSAKTPCVLIECGVGQHKPDDYEVLFTRRELVVRGILQGLLKAFNIEENDMTDDQKRAVEALESFRKEFNHGNLEGAANAAIGAARDLPGKDKQIQVLQERVLVLESDQKKLADRITALESNIAADLKLISDWQTKVETANKKLETQNKTIEDLTSEKNAIKGRYEAKCEELRKLDKMTAWGHIRYGINLLVKKQK